VVPRSLAAFFLIALRHSSHPGPAHEFWYRAIIMLMTGFVELEAIRRDEEFVLYRGEHSDRSGSPSVLLLAPASMPLGR
jgi:hypothetical protein